MERNVNKEVQESLERKDKEIEEILNKIPLIYKDKEYGIKVRNEIEKGVKSLPEELRKKVMDLLSLVVNLNANKLSSLKNAEFGSSLELSKMILDSIYKIMKENNFISSKLELILYVLNNPAVKFDKNSLKMFFEDIENLWKGDLEALRKNPMLFLEYYKSFAGMDFNEGINNILKKENLSINKFYAFLYFSQDLIFVPKKYLIPLAELYVESERLCKGCGFFSALVSSNGFNFEIAKSFLNYYKKNRGKLTSKEFRDILIYLLTRKYERREEFERALDSSVRKFMEQKEKHANASAYEVVFGKSRAKNAKKRIMNCLESYYENAKGVEREEIEDRLSYVRKALEELEDSTLERILSSIKLSLNFSDYILTGEEIEDLKLTIAFFVFFPAWIRYGKEANDVEFPNVNVIAFDEDYEGGFIAQYSEGTIYVYLDIFNYDNSIQNSRENNIAPFLRRIANTMAHEAMHGLPLTKAYKSSGVEALNEFATSFLQSFYLPKNKSETLGVRGVDSTRVPELIKRAYGKEEIEHYLSKEYPSYLFMQYITASISRKQVLEYIRNGKFDELFTTTQLEGAIKSFVWKGAKIINKREIISFLADSSNANIEGILEYIRSLPQERQEEFKALKDLLEVYLSYRNLLKNLGILDLDKLKELDRAFLKDIYDIGFGNAKVGRNYKELFKNTFRVLDKYLGKNLDKIPLENFVYGEVENKV